MPSEGFATATYTRLEVEKEGGTSFGLVFADRNGRPMDEQAIEETLNSMCLDQARRDNGFEVSWILTILRQLGLPLDLSAGRLVAQMSDNCALLLLMEAREQSASLRQNVDVNAAVQRAEMDDAFVREDWLLAHEARTRGWCRPRSWRKAPAWKELKDNGVQFLVSKGESPLAWWVLERPVGRR
jgi:hypothetical protein